MSDKTMFKKVSEFFASLAGKGDGFGKLDVCILKTLMRLAAVDGDFSQDEMALFKEMASKCKGYGEETFAKLWDEALHSAGYLFLQSKIVSTEELVKEFVRECEADFAAEISVGVTTERDYAFKCLEEMAAADGDYSEIERASITALSEKVKALRLAAMQERYPRAMVSGK